MKTSKKNNLRFLLSLYHGHGTQLFWATFWFIVKHSPTYIIPIVAANMINLIADPVNHTLSELWLNLLVGTIFIAQNIVTTWLHTRAYSSLTRSIEMELRGAMVHKLQRLTIQYHTQVQSGKLLSKIMRDVESVEQMLQSCFGSIVPLITSVTVAVVVTAYRNPVILWLYLLAVPIAGITVGVFRRPINRSNQEFRKEMEQTQAAVSDMLKMVPVTRAYGLGERENDRMDGLLAGVKSSGYRLDTTNSLFGASSWAVFQLFQLGCLGVTGILAWQDLISPGEVVLYQNYFGQIVSAVSGVVNLFPVLARGMESMRSIDEIMTSNDEEQSGCVPAPKPLRGEITFENVSYRFPDAETPILHDFSLHVPAGTSIAFVGPSGAGKSTLLSLLTGFTQPETGRICVDGIDLRNMNLTSYRNQIAIVPQNTVLFTGTLRDNIAYADSNATDEEILSVIERLGLKSTVESLPKGLNTDLRENGGNFSGGQRQRISIARALIRKPRVILFDEATSALDTESEALVTKAVQEMTGNCTTFLVAHRLSTIQTADWIVVIEDGHITEQGRYQDLMQKKGRFYTLKALSK